MTLSTNVVTAKEGLHNIQHRTNSRLNQIFCLQWHRTVYLPIENAYFPQESLPLWQLWLDYSMTCDPEKAQAVFEVSLFDLQLVLASHTRTFTCVLLNASPNIWPSLTSSLFSSSCRAQWRRATRWPPQLRKVTWSGWLCSKGSKLLESCTIGSFVWVHSHPKLPNDMLLNTHYTRRYSQTALPSLPHKQQFFSYQMGRMQTFWLPICKNWNIPKQFHKTHCYFINFSVCLNMLLWWGANAGNVSLCQALKGSSSVCL